MTTATVWMPLAINPWNGPSAAHAGSVWIGCGSYCWAKPTMSSSDTVTEPKSYDAPTT